MHKIIVAAFCACLLVSSGCGRQPARSLAAGPPVVPVSVAKAARESVPTELRVVGTVEASTVIQVKSQVAGQLLRVSFTEGQDVQKGDLLLEIDPQPFEDALRQAEAAVTRDQAQIAQAEATLARDEAQAKYAEGEAARQQQLYQKGISARMQADLATSTLDADLASARASKASIETAKATLESDLAAVAAAKLNLSYCQIHAPVSGRTGNLLVQAGNLVKANDVPLVVIHQISSVFVTFSVPEQYLGTIRRLSAQRKLAVRAYPRGTASRNASGYVTVIDNTVDVATATIPLKATFENSDRLLWPGEFVDAVLTLDTIQNATVVPAEAVQAGQQGQFLYAVKPDNTVEIRLVSTGPAFGQKVVIEKGVTPGETIVTDGQLRLFPGAKIRAVDASKLGGAL